MRANRGDRRSRGGPQGHAYPYHPGGRRLRRQHPVEPAVLTGLPYHPWAFLSKRWAWRARPTFSTGSPTDGRVARSAPPAQPDAVGEGVDRLGDTGTHDPAVLLGNVDHRGSPASLQVQLEAPRVVGDREAAHHHREVAEIICPAVGLDLRRLQHLLLAAGHGPLLFVGPSRSAPAVRPARCAVTSR